MMNPEDCIEATTPSAIYSDAIFNGLLPRLEEYLRPEQIAEVFRSYEYGAKAHLGQLRKSGEPYITHPVAVAGILAQMRLDPETLQAAILHDVIEDTAVSKNDILNEFGETVAELVDGVTKLTHMDFQSKAEEQAEYFRKMMMAMARDLRVIMIKLADRLHNMRTLGVMRPDKRRRIARETQEIYAPVAQRLGMNALRIELEDLSFQAYHPLRFNILRNTLKRSRNNRREIINTVRDKIVIRLEEMGIEGEVLGRAKHLFSLYKKIKQKTHSFAKVYDIFALRIIVKDVDQCYRVLGLIHTNFKPLPGRFKDYIAIPKGNGYQSVHTAIFGPHGGPIEIQIRTEDMNRAAEAGIAAHWLYKSDAGEAHHSHLRAQEWIKDLLEIQRQAGNSQEFLESVKVDLFPDEIYVFTPMGEILKLPTNATPVDFAYAVHTDVGNSCIGVRIDRHYAPLSSRLQNGQTIEVVTSKGVGPKANWLNFAVTAKARTAIRHYLKNIHHNDAVKIGRRLLDKALSGYSMHLDQISDEQIEGLKARYEYDDFDVLLADIAMGSRPALLIARDLAPEDVAGAHKSNNNHPLIIRGTEGMVVSFAKCCHPIPGDHVLASHSTGKGIVIHRDICGNVADLAAREEHRLDVEWADEIDSSFDAEIHLEASDEVGGLAIMAAAISKAEGNIKHVAMEDRDGQSTGLVFTIAVRGRNHLAKIMKRLHREPLILKIWRS